MTPPISREPVEILFVGNSFTHGHCPPAQYYNAAAITDLNGTGYGGVPAIFQRLTADAGFDFKVSIEAGCGMTLRGHYERKADLLRSRPWDVVVLQELSLSPLPASRGGDPGCFLAGATNLVQLLRAANPAVKIYLYETWASPASVDSGGYGREGGLRRMQQDLRENIAAVCDRLGLAGVVRVGEAFLQAVEQGLVAPGPAGARKKITLWAEDSRHAGVHGSYLAAAMFFLALSGADSLSAVLDGGRLVGELGLENEVAEQLGRIAGEVGGRTLFSGRS